MISFHSYIRELLHAVSPSASISSEVVETINSLLYLTMKKLVDVALDKVALRKQKTLQTIDIRFAARFLMHENLHEPLVLSLTSAIVNWNSDFTGTAAKRAKLTFPPTRILNKVIRPLTPASRVGGAVGVALAAVVESIAGIMLEQAALVTQDAKRMRIVLADLLTAIRELPEISSLYEGVLVAGVIL